MRVERFGRVFLSLTAFIWLALAAVPTAAQPSNASAQEASKADLERLIETIEDDERRAELLAELKALLRAQEEVTETERPSAARRVIDAVLGGFSGLVSDGENLVHGFDPARLSAWLERQYAVPERRAMWIGLGWQLLLVIAIGVLAKWGARALLSTSRRAIETRPIDDIGSRIFWLIARTALDIAPLVAFGVASWAAVVVFAPEDSVRPILMAAIAAIVVARSIIALARAVLTPTAPSLRLWRLDDNTAAYIFVWIKRLTNLAVYGTAIAEIAAIAGVPPGVSDLLARIVGLLVAILVIILILQNRIPVARAINRLGGEELMPRGMRIARDRFADVWHILAIIYVLAIFVVAVLNVEGGSAYLARGTIGTVVIVLVARLIVVMGQRLGARLFRVGDDLIEKYPFIEERANAYLPIIRAIFIWIVEIVAAVAVLQMWEVEALAWMQSDIAIDVFGRLLTIAIVLIVSLVVWEGVSGWINVYLDRRDGEGEPVVHSARVRTLLPLLRNVLLVFIAVMAIMITLSELGLDIGPLIAGAGVIGLAIGFGAQTMVKDFITGLFILFEDTFYVGDVVSIAGKAGIVESMTVRTVRMRDLQGTVHTIPFSAVDTIENLTKEFSYALFDVGIAYREDVDQVIDVLAALAEDLRADPDFGGDILEPLEVLGLDRFDDSAIIVRVRLKTRPITQWRIKREFNRRMKRRFDELGIEIPFPHQTIYFGVDRDGSAPPAHLKIEGAGATGGPQATDERATPDDAPTSGGDKKD